MADKPSDLVQGTLDMLILKTLALEPMHGYGVAVRIEQISKGVFHVKCGLVVCGLPALATSRTD
jgi:PadR family transcriptional regulator, regulatory protein PadR